MNPNGETQGIQSSDTLLGTNPTRSTALLNFNAAVDLRFGELLEAWNLADDEARDGILDAVRQACLRIPEGDAS